MVSRPQEVPTDSEEILHDTVNRREPLELSGRRETPHLALTLSCRLMRHLVWCEKAAEARSVLVESPK